MKKKVTSDEKLLKDPNSLLPGKTKTYHQFMKSDFRILKTFDAPISEHSFTYPPLVTLFSNEMTALCPLTSQPDWYQLRVSYIPKEKCIESKSFKHYVGSYRDEGGFIETIATRILDDCISACDPRYAKVDITMNVRGGVGITVVKEYPKKD